MSCNDVFSLRYLYHKENSKVIPFQPGHHYSVETVLHSERVYSDELCVAEPVIILSMLIYCDRVSDTFYLFAKQFQLRRKRG